jgi:hypothetical protein
MSLRFGDDNEKFHTEGVLVDQLRLISYADCRVFPNPVFPRCDDSVSKSQLLDTLLGNCSNTFHEHIQTNGNQPLLQPTGNQKRHFGGL